LKILYKFLFKIDDHSHFVPSWPDFHPPILL
jgi:hypothetical protein